MENKRDNIELRSDKVRSIIGQIPPWIVRSGITVILIVVIILLAGSYFFKYPYIIKTNIEFVEKDNSFVGIIHIPANEISKIKKGQEIKVYFDKIQNLNGLRFVSKINNISDSIIISNKKGFFIAKIDKIENLIIHERIKGIAIIKTEEISFFERIIKSFKSKK